MKNQKKIKILMKIKTTLQNKDLDKKIISRANITPFTGTSAPVKEASELEMPPQGVLPSSLTPNNIEDDYKNTVVVVNQKKKNVIKTESKAIMNFKGLRESLVEKTLTPAEKSKREEIAKAIHKENPNMPMAKKMAIATAQAKKVAEETIKEHYIKYHILPHDENEIGRAHV